MLAVKNVELRLSDVVDEKKTDINLHKLLFLEVKTIAKNLSLHLSFTCNMIFCLFYCTVLCASLPAEIVHERWRNHLYPNDRYNVFHLSLPLSTCITSLLCDPKMFLSGTEE